MILKKKSKKNITALVPCKASSIFPPSIVLIASSKNTVPITPK